MILFKKIKNYFFIMRVHEPTGFFLLLWPTYWGLWISNSGPPKISTLIIFTIEAFLTRCAGCVINDIIDRKIDSNISRTKKRILPSKKINLIEAKILFSLLILVSFCIELIFINKNIFVLSIITLILICIYPFFKRISYFPQIILAITFSMSILIVYANSIKKNFLNKECLILYLINIIWCIMYDTQYALLDKNDDLILGIKSTAVFFSKFNTLFITTLQLLILILIIFLGIKKNFNFFFTCSVS